MSESFANRFSSARKQLGLNQKELAAKLGVSPSHISSIESGKKMPSDRLVELFSLKFNISKDWLIYGTETISTSDDKSSQERIGNVYLDKRDVYETATGYVIRYMQLLKFFCVAGDLNEDFEAVTSNSGLEIVLNFILGGFMEEADEGGSFERTIYDVLLDNVPGFSEYADKYIRTKTNNLSYLASNHPHIWNTAMRIERMLDGDDPIMGSPAMNDLVNEEARLLSQNISGVIDLQ